MIEKRGSKWRASVEYVGTDGHRHRLTRTVDTRRDAKTAEAELLAERAKILSGVPADSEEQTFRGLVAEYERWRGCRTRVLEKNASHLKYRLAGIADMKVSAITRPVLARLQGEIEQSDYSTAVRSETIQLVRSVFAYRARIYGVDDPAVVMHRIRKTPDEVQAGMQHPVWTPGQMEKFLSAVPDDRRVYKVFFETLFWTGMRRGELIALQMDDVDTEHHSLIVAHSKRNRTQKLAPTKTSQRRVVTVDDVTWADVMDVYDHSAGPFLFGGEDSLSPTTLDRIFHDVSEAAGLPRIRIHDLRHSHATWLINSGVNIVAVSRRLGHASIEQTLKTYAHLLPETSSVLLDMLNSEHEKISHGWSLGGKNLEANETEGNHKKKTASECGDVKRNKTEKKT